MKMIPGLVLVTLLSAAALPAAAKTSQVYSYIITHPVYGAIGTYERSSSDFDGLTRADAHLRIVVRVLGLVVRRETSDQTEVWRAHRLISFESLTSTNGKPSTIRGVTAGDGFAVTTSSGTKTAPGDVFASDPWFLNRIGHGSVVSTRTGEVSSVEVTGGEADRVLLHGVSEPARHYHVNSARQPNKWEVCINSRGVPIKFRSSETGGAIDFTLVSAPPAAGEPTDAAALEHDH